MTCLLREHIVGLPHSPGSRVARTYTLATLDLKTLDLARSAVDFTRSAVDLARSAVDSLVDSASSAVLVARSAVRTKVPGSTTLRSSSMWRTCPPPPPADT